MSDALIAAGEPPMGFLDPWLYATGTGWHGFMGVVDGSAVGCGGWAPRRRGGGMQ